MTTTSRRQLLQGAAAGTALLSMPSLTFAQSAGVFRIGALNPITGSGSTFGTGMLKAIQAAADVVNAAGGAGGVKFEVVSEDTQTSPPAGVLAAK